MDADAETDWACSREAAGAESATATAIGIDTGGCEYAVASRCNMLVLEVENWSAKETLVKFCSGCCNESRFPELIGEEGNAAAAAEGAADADDEYPGTVDGDMGGEKDGGRWML